MKYLVLAIVLFISSHGFGQSDIEKQNKQRKDTAVSNPQYDKELALKLGADVYGMKSYFFVMLKKGNNTTTDKNFINTCFKGHMENIKRLVDEKKLIIAGPFAKNDAGFKGIFIIHQVKSAEEVKELLQKDDAIKNGILDYDIFTWYGSAALPEYLPFSDKIWKKEP